MNCSIKLTVRCPLSRQVSRTSPGKVVARCNYPPCHAEKQQQWLSWKPQELSYRKVRRTSLATLCWSGRSIPGVRLRALGDVRTSTAGGTTATSRLAPRGDFSRAQFVAAAGHMMITSPEHHSELPASPGAARAGSTVWNTAQRQRWRPRRPSAGLIGITTLRPATALQRTLR